MTYRIVRRAITGFAAMVAAFAGVAPASAQGLTGYPDLQVSATFDKPAYDSGDVVHVTLTITNIGTIAAEDVYAYEDWDSGLLLDYPGWGDLSYGGDPVRLEAGATRVFEFTGTIGEPGLGAVRFSGQVVPAGGFDANPYNNVFSLYAPVRLTYGDFGGTVIEDRNGNGLADPGEGIGGIRVYMNGGAPYGFYEQVTDVQGRFFFDDLPTGRYFSYYYSPDGWVVGPGYPDQDTWVIGSEGVPDATVLAVRPLSDRLLVNAEFQYDSYQVGDEAHVALTLRNRTDSTMTGIHAFCNGIGDPNQFSGVGPGWAEFVLAGPGVTLAAGESRTFDVYESVPDGALTFGFVALQCEIGPGAGTGARGLPFVFARAKVPGLFTTVSAQIFYDADGDGWVNDGEGIANTWVALLDYGTHDVVARRNSDAQGRFQFVNIPTGLYVLHVMGPWQPAWSDSMVILALPDSGFEMAFGMRPRGSQPG